MNPDRRPTPYTYREYALLPEDTRRWELIDGDFFVSPSPTSRHQTVSRRLQYALMTCLEEPGIAQVFNAPMDVILSTTDVVQPDLVVVRDASIVTERAIEGVPDVVVEILSPSTRERDLYLKRALYERFGVPEYLVVDPRAGTIEAWTLGEDGKYSRRALLHRKDTLTSAVFPEVAVALAPVFAEQAPRAS